MKTSSNPPLSTISRNDFILQINKENGQNPKTWLNLIAYDVKTKQSDSSKKLNLLEKALSSILSTSATSQNYLELWKLLTNELKALDLSYSQLMFQRLELVAHLKKNAYFYSCFFNVAFYKNNYEEGKAYLKRGLINRAQPSVVISSAFKLLSSITLQNKNNNFLENKENIILEEAINQSNNNLLKVQSGKQIFQSPLNKKPSISELRKTIQTPPTRKINPDENIQKINILPFEEIKSIELPPNDPGVVELPIVIPQPSPHKIQNNKNENIAKEQQQCSPMRKKKKMVPTEPLQFNTRIQLTEWQSHVIFVNMKTYLKLSRIGSGGSSKVYKVLHEAGNIYAIKQVSLEIGDDTVKNGYIEEIKLLQRLKNYNGIIKLIDWELNSEEKVLNIVLELGEIDLACLLHKSGPLLHQAGENYLRMYWQQMLEAVRVLHEQERIIHGDLKPQNFVSVKSHIKLIDFGIAKAIHTDTTNIHANNIMGTLNYLAPEILMNHYGEGKTKYGMASDIWSLGCIFYQMIYGKPPLHSFDSPTAIKWLTNPNLVFEYKVNPMTNEPIPAIVEEVLSLCLQKDPNKRPTCTQLLNHPFLRPLMLPVRIVHKTDSSKELEAAKNG